MAESRSVTFDKKKQMYSSRVQHKPRSHNTPGGPGMQAIFLDSSKRSCGTGVFLPRRTGTDSRPSKKPACSPVLLPSRLVETLNLNVHELGSQSKSPPDTGCNLISIGHKSSANMMGNKETSTQQCCVISHSRSVLPDIFLPKEWTY